MATLTPNIGLKKPAGSEYPKISDAVNDNADILDTNIAKLQEGIAVVVDGDTATVAVPAGGYAYIKNNEYGLPDGLYKNTSSSVFPVTGGTANSAVFTAVPAGAVNDAVSATNDKIGNTALPTTAQTLTGAIAEHEQDITSLSDKIAKLQEGIAIIVDGDTSSVAVPVGGYAYLKNNMHGLADGLYKNTSSSAFPVSGGTADGTVFSTVPTGAVNDVVSNLFTTETVLPSGVHFYKTGNLVEISYSITGNDPGVSVTGGSYSYIDYVPSDLRPANNHAVIGIAANGNGTVIGVVGIQRADGRIFIQSATTAVFARFSMTYCI